jgi:serine/threonine protein kinase
MNDIKYKRLINALGYQIVNELWPSRLKVYHVRNDLGDFVAKFPSKRGNEEDMRQLFQERRALSYGKEIPGIPRLTGFYDEFDSSFPKLTTISKRKSLADQRKRLIIVIRSYLEGEILKDGDKIKGQESQSLFNKTIQGLHKKGIARLDFKYSNILIDSSGRPCFIDLGDSAFSDYVSKSDFNNYCCGDLKNMESFFA